MTMYDYIWLCMTMYDHICLCTIMNAYVWLCMSTPHPPAYWYFYPTYEFLCLNPTPTQTPKPLGVYIPCKYISPYMATSAVSNHIFRLHVLSSQLFLKNSSWLKYLRNMAKINLTIDFQCILTPFALFW